MMEWIRCRDCLWGEVDILPCKDKRKEDEFDIVQDSLTLNVKCQHPEEWTEQMQWQKKLGKETKEKKRKYLSI